MLIQILEKPVQLQCPLSKQAKQARRTKLFDFAWQIVCSATAVIKIYTGS